MTLEQDLERVARQEERLRFPSFDATQRMLWADYRNPVTQKSAELCFNY